MLPSVVPDSVMYMSLLFTALPCFHLSTLTSAETADAFHHGFLEQDEMLHRPDCSDAGVCAATLESAETCIACVPMWQICEKVKLYRGLQVR